MPSIVFIDLNEDPIYPPQLEVGTRFFNDIDKTHRSREVQGSGFFCDLLKAQETGVTAKQH
jgi:hypothetical protein